MFSSSGSWFLSIWKPLPNESKAKARQENPENNQTSEGKPEPLPPRQFSAITSTMVTMEKPNLSRRSLMVSPPLPIKSPTSAIFSRWGPADFEEGRFQNNRLEQFHFPGTAFFRFHMSHQKETSNATWTVKYWLVKRVIPFNGLF